MTFNDKLLAALFFALVAVLALATIATLHFRVNEHEHPVESWGSSYCVNLCETNRLRMCAEESRP